MSNIGSRRCRHHRRSMRPPRPMLAEEEGHLHQELKLLPFTGIRESWATNCWQMERRRGNCW